MKQKKRFIIPLLMLFGIGIYNHEIMNGNSIVHQLLSTTIMILVGWLLVQYVPKWLSLKNKPALIVKIVGVIIIIGSLLSWA